MDLISELRRGGLWRSFVIWTDNISTPWSPEHTVSSGVNSADTKWKLITNEQLAVQSLLNKLHKPQSRKTWQKAALSENLANFFLKPSVMIIQIRGLNGTEDIAGRLNKFSENIFIPFPLVRSIFIFFTKDVVWMFGVFFLFFFLSFCLPCHGKTLLFC